MLYRNMAVRARGKYESEVNDYPRAKSDVYLVRTSSYPLTLAASASLSMQPHSQTVLVLARRHHLYSTRPGLAEAKLKP